MISKTEFIRRSEIPSFRSTMPNKIHYTIFIISFETKIQEKLIKNSFITSEYISSLKYETFYHFNYHLIKLFYLNNHAFIFTTKNF